LRGLRHRLTLHRLDLRQESHQTPLLCGERGAQMVQSREPLGESEWRGENRVDDRSTSRHSVFERAACSGQFCTIQAAGRPRISPRSGPAPRGPPTYPESGTQPATGIGRVCRGLAVVGRRAESGTAARAPSASALSSVPTGAPWCETRSRPADRARSAPPAGAAVPASSWSSAVCRGRLPASTSAGARCRPGEDAHLIRPASLRCARRGPRAGPAPPLRPARGRRSAGRRVRRRKVAR
jgi:hypothetical protein